MRMERLAATMPHSTVKAFRRYAQVHDVELCVAAKIAVTKYCRQTPTQYELDAKANEKQDRIFISMPDTAMRLLEFWATNSGIPKTKLIEWAIRKMAEEQNESEEEKRT